MSLTEADTVFAGVNESALNDMLTALLTTRGHYLHHGSPPLVTADTPQVTLHDPIGFPGTAGIAWAVDFSVPRIDLFPDSSGTLPPEIVVADGQFTLRTTAVFTLVCGRAAAADGWVKRQAELSVWALGSFDVGTDDLGFVLDHVELVDIAPAPLEDLLECLIQQLLGGALRQVRLPLDKLRAGAFALTLTRTAVNDNQIKLYGRV